MSRLARIMPIVLLLLAASAFIGCGDPGSSAGTPAPIQGSRINVTNGNDAPGGNIQAYGGYAFSSSNLQGFPWDVYPVLTETGGFDYGKTVNSGNYDESPVINVISTREQLDGYFNETYSIGLYGTAYATDFQDVMGLYGHDFFATRQLITFFASKPGSNVQFELGEASYADGTLRIPLYIINDGSSGTAAFEYWFLMIETGRTPEGAIIEFEVIRQLLGNPY